MKRKFVFLMMVFVLNVIVALPVLARTKLPNCPNSHCNTHRELLNDLCISFGYRYDFFFDFVSSDGNLCSCFCECNFVQNQNIRLEISPMIHPSRRLIQFYIQNLESKAVFCRYIKTSAIYKDGNDQEIGIREVSINKILSIEPNSLRRSRARDY